MSTDAKGIVSKYEERFVRRLGEIAILLHLARSPEGSHAYEMRQKASEILFEKRNIGKQFLQKHLNILNELNEFLSTSEITTMQKKEFAEGIKKWPIFYYNQRIQQILSDKHGYSKDDEEYLTDLIETLQESIKEMKETSVIWSKISGIYPAIDSLEKNGLIELIRKDSEGDRLKKIYTITELGRESLSRVMMSLLDISSFIFDSEIKPDFYKKEALLSPRLIPFRKIFEKFSDDLSPDFKKKLLSQRGFPHGGPFVSMMMEQGMAMPRLNILVSHPEMLDEQLEAVETKEDKNLFKTFIKKRLLERRRMIDKLLEKL